MIVSPIHIGIFALYFWTLVNAVPKFHKGGYKNIIVGVGDDILFDAKLEHNLLATSDKLYVATHGLAYFEEVIIVGHHVGSMRSRTYTINAGRHYFSNADIKIDRRNPELGDIPYTLQAGECGEPGKYIHLTPNFLRELNSDKSNKQAAGLLVTEWAHFRYGVFVERASWEDDSFQWEGSKLAPWTCQDRIKGWALADDYEPCVLDCYKLQKGCKFYPDLKSNEGIEASLMSYPHLPGVKYFCNGSNHNTIARFLQNRMCNSKSIMDVIRAHEDFRVVHQSKMKNTTIVFKNIVNESLSFVFMVESSKSMEKGNIMQMLEQFFERFFKDPAMNGAQAMLVKFSNVTKIIKDFVQVGKEDFIQQVSTPIQFSYTSPHIGNALQNITEMLNLTRKIEGATIFLISTGEGEIIENQYHLVQRSDVIIHSIGIGRKPSWKLDELSRMTGGVSYFLDTSRRPPRWLDLDMAFLASMHFVTKANLQPVVICYEQMSTTNNVTIFLEVEEGMGKDFIVRVFPSNLNTRLVRRYRSIVSEPIAAKEYGFPSATLLNFEDIMPGRWELQVNHSLQLKKPLEIMVTCKPGNQKDFPIRVHSWIANVTGREASGTKRYHRIYADVKKGHHAVVNATVIATVEILDQQPIEVILRDNGASPDVFKYDGVYSNFFPVTIRPASRPVVIVRVRNDGNAKLLLGSKRSGAVYEKLKDDKYERITKKIGESKSRFPEDSFAKLERKYSCEEGKEPVLTCVEYMTLPFFNRSVMVNSPVLFKMTEKEIRLIPPTVIRDLKVRREYIRGSDFHVVLRWTSPEHPRQGAKVSLIEVAGSSRQSIFSKEFHLAEINTTLNHVVSAGEIQEMEVVIRGYPMTCVAFTDTNTQLCVFYFAVRARDKEGNIGEASNAAEAIFIRNETTTMPASTIEKSTSSSSIVAGSFLIINIAVLGTLGYWN